MAVSAGGGVYVWGHNEYGQLGTGDTQRELRGSIRDISALSHMHLRLGCGPMVADFHVNRRNLNLQCFHREL